MQFPFPVPDVFILPPDAGPTERRIEIDSILGEIRFYDENGTLVIVLGGESPGADNRLKFPTGDPGETTPASIFSLIFGAGGTRNLDLHINSGEFGSNQSPSILLRSQSDDNSESSRIVLGSGPLRVQVAFASGSNRPLNEATLVAGTVTVAHTGITASSLIFLSRRVAGGTLGHLSYTRIAGTSFTINSSSATDTSTVSYFIVEPT
jgi:hypothetical protein